MYRQRLGRLTMLAAALCMSAACQDLDVPNLNDPDRIRALQNPEDVVAFAGSAFPEAFQALHGNGGAQVQHFMNYATEFTTTSNTNALMQEMSDPRGVLDNDPSISVIGPQGPRRQWRDLLGPASISYDVLRLLDEGLVLEDANEVDITVRTRAYLKLVQGWMWGYLGALYDQAPVFHEEIEPAAETTVATNQQALEILRPYSEARDAALEALDEVIALASANTFTFPTYPTDVLWFGAPAAAPVTNQDMVRMANTLAARFLVLTARTPEERRNVDWQRVLQYTANGVTKDFEVSLANGFRDSDVYQNARQSTGYRWDMLLIGHADIAGGHQAWMATPLPERNRYNITTPDRRITGATPTSAGAYTRYRTDNTGFELAYGTQHFSAYQWHRHAAEVGISATSNSHGDNQGTARLISVDENRLYRAEALIYTGDLPGAVQLINVTRTATKAGLPAATVSGAPHSSPTANNCVPRTDAGACGDLMHVLWWERMIENAGLDLMRGFADGRAFGLFVEGSYVHFPLPGNEAAIIGVPFYTFGGVGTEWGATYAPLTMANAQ